jgi:hypothetical protein
MNNLIYKLIEETDNLNFQKQHFYNNLSIGTGSGLGLIGGSVIGGTVHRLVAGPVSDSIFNASGKIDDLMHAVIRSGIGGTIGIAIGGVIGYLVRRKHLWKEKIKNIENAINNAKMESPKNEIKLAELEKMLKDAKNRVIDDTIKIENEVSHRLKKNEVLLNKEKEKLRTATKPDQIKQIRDNINKRYSLMHNLKKVT